MYQNHAGLEAVLLKTQHLALHKEQFQLLKAFFEINPTIRTTKHVSDPLNGSAAKRINMFYDGWCEMTQRVLILVCGNPFLWLLYRAL